MGNAAVKSADSVGEAVQVLLETPLSGGASGRSRGDLDEYEEGQEDDISEEEVLLGYIFGDDSGGGGGGFADEKAFYEVIGLPYCTIYFVCVPHDVF